MERLSRKVKKYERLILEMLADVSKVKVSKRGF